MGLLCDEFSTFNCDSRKSVGGINKTRVVNTSYISGVTIDSFDRVSGITLANNAVWYDMDETLQRSVFTETSDLSAKGLKWDAELKIGVVKGDFQKRLVIQSFINRRLTVLYTDRNNKHWLIGHPIPLRLRNSTKTTGDWSGQNGYDLMLRSSSYIQSREVLQSVIDNITTNKFECPEHITINTTLLEMINCFLNDYIAEDLP